MIVQVNEARSKCGSLSYIISCMAKLRLEFIKLSSHYSLSPFLFSILFQFRLNTIICMVVQIESSVIE